MARLIYSAIMSLDGYVADGDGRFDWAVPDEEVHAFAAQAIAAGLVDEYQLFVVPTVVGGGIRSLPGQVRLNLELAAERRFGSGVIYLRYRPA
jgi:dihydrofolate reductase